MLTIYLGITGIILVFGLLFSIKELKDSQQTIIEYLKDSDNSFYLTLGFSFIWPFLIIYGILLLVSDITDTDIGL